MNTIDSWICPMNIFHLHAYCFKNTTSAISEGFRNKFFSPALHDFYKIRSKEFSVETSTLSYYLQHMPSKFINLVLIWVKFQIIMNGLDSVIINFLQVQLWKSVTSIKSLCQVSLHCHFLHSGFVGINKQKKPPNQTPPITHTQKRPFCKCLYITSTFGWCFWAVLRCCFCLKNLTAFIFLHFILTQYFFRDIMELKLHCVF